MTNSVVEAINDVGGYASSYKRSPLGRGVFAAGMNRIPPIGEIKIWEKISGDIDVATSNKYQQVLVNVNEDTRYVDLKVRAHDSGTRKNVSRDYAERTLLSINRNLVTANGARARVIELDDPVVTEGREGRYYWYAFTGKIRWTIPASKQTMLMGMDEKYQFIAALRDPVDSVAKAHDALRPEGVSRNAIRQGEWFFLPVNKAMQETLDEEAFSRPDKIHSSSLGGTTHRVQQRLTYDGKAYAVGYVIDNRKAHHEPLWLPTWHEIVRNRELVRRATSVTRYWD